MAHSVSSASSAAPAVRAAGTGEPSVGTLVQSAMADVSTLIRAEVELAKAEVGKSAKKAGIGGGAFGAALVMVAFSAFFFGIAFAEFLTWLGLERWISYLIVWFLLVLLGRARRPVRHADDQEDREARADPRDAARPARRHAPRGARRPPPRRARREQRQGLPAARGQLPGLIPCGDRSPGRPTRRDQRPAPGSRGPTATSPPTASGCTSPRPARARWSLLLHGFPQFWWTWRAQLTAPGRRRVPRRRPRPARLRRQRQAAPRLRPAQPLGRRRRAGAGARRAGGRHRRARLGRAARLDDGRAAPAQRAAAGRAVDGAPAAAAGRHDRSRAAAGVALHAPLPAAPAARAPADPRRRRPGRRPDAALGRSGVGAHPRLRRRRRPLPRGRAHPAGRLRRDGVPPLGGPLPAAPRRPALRPPDGRAGHRADAAAARRARPVRAELHRPRVGPLRGRRLRVAGAPRHRPLPPGRGARRRQRSDRRLGRSSGRSGPLQGPRRAARRGGHGAFTRRRRCRPRCRS